MAKKTKKAAVKKPQTSEETGRQIQFSDVLGFISTFKGFGPPPAGLYKVYRQMRRNPTVALARALATAPVCTASWGISADDEATDDQVAFIEKEIESIWPEFLRNTLMALDYGWAPFEKVWEEKDGKWHYKKLKPLLVDITNVLVDKDTGGFKGIKQVAFAKNVELAPEYCFVFTHDGEAGDLYGRSRHENIRETAWHHWGEIAKRRAGYASKVAGITPLIEYPEGKSYDKSGAEQDNFDLAVKVLTQLGQGHGVAMPNTFSKWAEDLTRSGVDIGKLKAWQISFLEAKGAHGKSFSDMLRHSESLIMRGWLIPERTATEGQYGTKAESEAQGHFALMIADLLLEDIIRATNKYLVNPLLLYNFGEKAVNTIRLERGGIDPDLREFYRKLISKVLEAPANIDLFLDWVDVDRLMDNTEIPKAEEVINIEPTEPQDETSPNIPPTDEDEATAATSGPDIGRLTVSTALLYQRVNDFLARGGRRRRRKRRGGGCK